MCALKEKAILTNGRCTIVSKKLKALLPRLCSVKKTKKSHHWNVISAHSCGTICCRGTHVLACSRASANCRAHQGLASHAVSWVWIQHVTFVMLHLSRISCHSPPCIVKYNEAGMPSKKKRSAPCFAWKPRCCLLICFSYYWTHFSLPFKGFHGKLEGQSIK